MRLFFAAPTPETGGAAGPHSVSRGESHSPPVLSSEKRAGHSVLGSAMTVCARTRSSKVVGSSHRRGSRTDTGARELRNINLARSRRTATDSSNAALAGASLAAPPAPPATPARDGSCIAVLIHPSGSRLPASSPWREPPSPSLLSVASALACLRPAGDDRLACLLSGRVAAPSVELVNVVDESCSIAAWRERFAAPPPRSERAACAF